MSSRRGGKQLQDSDRRSPGGLPLTGPWTGFLIFTIINKGSFIPGMPSKVASQLDATSHMAWENRIALDTILEEKGEVYVMVGGKRCTFISNNTAPAGTLAKALQGLMTLASWLKMQVPVTQSLIG